MAPCDMLVHVHAHVRSRRNRKDGPGSGSVHDATSFHVAQRYRGLFVCIEIFCLSLYFFLLRIGQK